MQFLSLVWIASPFVLAPSVSFSHRDRRFNLLVESRSFWHQIGPLGTQRGRGLCQNRLVAFPYPLLEFSVSNPCGDSSLSHSGS